jgi:hypothetical protein
MYKPFVALLGMLLGSHAPAAAQTPAPQLVLAHERSAPTMAVLPTVSTALPPGSTVLSQGTGNSPARFNRLFVGAYERDSSLGQLLPMERVKNLLFTQVNLPLVQLWSGRLQLDAFQRTFRIQDVQLGLPGYSNTQDFPSARQSYYGGPNSVRFSGLSLSFHFGGDARAAHPAVGLRRLTRVVGNVLN